MSDLDVNENDPSLLKDKKAKLIYELTFDMTSLNEKNGGPDLIQRNRSKEIHTKAFKILQHYEEEKESFLMNVHGLVKPAAKKVTDKLLQSLNKLKEDLEKNLKDPQKSEVDWITHAKQWVQVYAKWQDDKAFTEDIIEQVKEQTSQQITKDLMVLEEYQQQSLASLNVEEVERLQLKERLQKVIEEPLKMMGRLSEAPSDMSLDKVAEWIARVQEDREKFFNSLLVKIENVVKESIISEVITDPIYLNEIGQEVTSIQQEWKDISEQIKHVSHEQEKKSLRLHIESLLEHAEKLSLHSLPEDLSIRLQTLISHLKGCQP